MNIEEIVKTFEKQKPVFANELARHKRNGSFFMPIRDGDYSDVVKSLRESGQHEGKVLMGIGGGINLSIMAALDMKGAILIAPDYDQYKLWQSVMPLISESNSKEECRKKLAGFIEKSTADSDEAKLYKDRIFMNAKHYEIKALLGDNYTFPPCFYEEPTDFSFGVNPDISFKDVCKEQSFDFLNSDQSFGRVKKAVKDKNIGIVGVNIFSFDEMVKLVDLLGEENRVSIVRISNILMHYAIAREGYLGDSSHGILDKLKRLDNIFTGSPSVIEHSSKTKAVGGEPQPMIHESFSACAGFYEKKPSGWARIK